MTMEEALRAEGISRGYETSGVAIVHSAGLRIEHRKGEGKQYAFDIPDYYEDLPDDMAQELAEAVWDHVTGNSHGISADIRRHIRFTHTDRYVSRNGLVPPEDVHGYDLAATVRTLKAAGDIAQDLAVYWINGEVALAAPSFRIIGIPLCMIEQPEDIPGEIIANAHILERRSHA